MKMYECFRDFDRSMAELAELVELVELIEPYAVALKRNCISKQNFSTRRSGTGTKPSGKTVSYPSW